MREIINPEETALRPQPHEDYGRLSIDLGTARTNEEIQIHGDYLAKISYDGSATTTYFKIDQRHAAKIYAKEFKVLKRRYARIFLTNTAQVGKTLVLQINELAVSEIEPDLDTGKLSEIEDAVEALEVLQGVDGAGDLQKVKEELEKVVKPIKVDDAAFTPTANSVMMAGAEYDDTTPDSVDEGDAGAIRMSSNRNLYIQLRDGAGNERAAHVDVSGQVNVTDVASLANLASILVALQIMDDWDDGADHAKVVPPQMLTDLLVEYDDNGTDTIAAPGAGFALEVLGYQVHEWENSTLAISTSAYLKFATSGKYLWNGLLSASGAIKNHYTSISGIRVRGNENEALTLRNADRTAGNSAVQVVVFYRTVAV